MGQYLAHEMASKISFKSSHPEKNNCKKRSHRFTMVPNQDVLDLKRLAVATVRHSIALVFGRSVLRTYVPFSVLGMSRITVLRTFRFPSY